VESVVKTTTIPKKNGFATEVHVVIGCNAWLLTPKRTNMPKYEHDSFSAQKKKVFTFVVIDRASKVKSFRICRLPSCFYSNGNPVGLAYCGHE
jgi:hypothetical protein